MRTIGLATLLLGQAGVGTAPATLQPVSPWNIEYADSMCVAGRSYGDAAAPITIGFRPTPFSDIVQVVVIGKRQQLGRQGRVDVTLTASGGAVSKELNGTRAHFPTGDKAILTFYVDRLALDALVGVPAVMLGASDVPSIAVALSLGKPVLAALRACEADLMKHFGFDPAKIAAIAKRAEGERPEEWISHEDYPITAMSAGQQGTVLIGWTIGTDGRAVDCRVLKTSGVPDLDQASCRALVKRARYRPALDAMGKPVESYGTRNVQWLLQH